MPDIPKSDKKCFYRAGHNDACAAFNGSCISANQLVVIVEIRGGIWRVTNHIDGIAIQHRAYL